MYSLVLLSAGKGTRFGKQVPKQYLTLAGKPMLVHTLERINKIDKIDEIIIVCEQEYTEKIQKFLTDYNIIKKVVFVQGGNTRQESMYNGLLKASNEKIIVHEAARPFVTKKDFMDLIECPAENVTYTYEIPFTVLKKDSNQKLSGILERKELVNIQLPQKFNKADLLNAHRIACEKNLSFTEDASMVYYTEKEVFCLPGKSYNIKMTEYIDLLYGEMLIKEDYIKEEI